MSNARKTILELNHSEARSFFLETKNYQNFDLPEYFNFTQLLQSLSTAIGEREINYFFYRDDAAKKNSNPKDYHKVNHKILGNKDGELAWRPFELMHPALYVAIVHKITSEDNWTALTERFKDFRNRQITVASIPMVRSKKKSHKAEQIRAWWEKFEQKSVELALEFQYVYDADVSDCYSSIYTHSISWALYGADEAYNQRATKSLGNKLDEHIQMMRHRRTNGIPQGSALSDFIAELIFGYADMELISGLSDLKPTDYAIIRYRDDYRIFVNDNRIGKRIMKQLTETLSTMGLKLNSTKTKINDDPVLASIKEDKIDELFIPNIKKEKDNFAKWLMQIYVTTLKHPNAGKTSRQLNVFHDELLKYKNSGKSLRHYENPEGMLSIVVNIALKNPKYYNLCAAVASILVDYAPEHRRGLLIDKIQRKFKNTPNTGMLDIWLQRISYKIDPAIIYIEPLTDLLPPHNDPYNNSNLWESTWLKQEIKDIINTTPIIDDSKLETMGIIISRDEVDIFQDIPS